MIGSEEQYLNLLERVFVEGVDRSDRTGTGTRSLFGEQLKIDLTRGFPLLTTKKVSFKNILTELLWFLRGDTNIKYLHEHGCPIWDEWADENGDLGPVYGAMWRNWRGFELRPLTDLTLSAGAKFTDQIAELIEGLKNNPDSRRHIVSAWNVTELPLMALPPCHCLFQCYARHGTLSLQMYQRSADLFLGVPYNIASYALLTHILGVLCDLTPGTLSICFGDVHIYQNHFEQVQLQLSRKPRPLPGLEIHYSSNYTIDDFKHEDFRLLDYNPADAIPAPVSV